MGTVKQKNKSPQLHPVEYFLGVLLFVLPIAASLFTLDIFSLNTPIGRVVFVDLILLSFVSLSLLHYLTIRASKMAIAVSFSLVLIGVAGILSAANALLTGLEISLGRAVMDSVRYLIYGLFIIMSTQYLQKTDLHQRYYQMWLLSVVCVVLIGVGQMLAVNGIAPFDPIFLWDNIRGGGSRIASTFRWQSPLVLYLGVSLPLIAAESVKASTRFRSAEWLATFGVGSIVLLGTGSRSSMLVLPLALAPFLTVVRGRETVTAVLGSIGGLTFATVIIRSDAINRAINLWGRLLADPTSEPRFQIWYEGAAAWLSISPVWGVGPRQLINYTRNLAHNSYLGVVFERGLLGLVAIMLLIIVLIRISSHLIQMREHGDWWVRVALSMAILNLLISMMTAETLSYRTTPVFLAFAVAMYDHEFLPTNR